MTTWRPEFMHPYITHFTAVRSFLLFYQNILRIVKFIYIMYNSSPYFCQEARRRKENYEQKHTSLNGKIKFIINNTWKLVSVQKFTRQVTCIAQTVSTTNVPLGETRFEKQQIFLNVSQLVPTKLMR